MQDQSELSQRPPRSLGELVLEICFVLVFGLTQVLVGARLVELDSQWGSVLLGLILGWLGADLLSGFVHFSADNWGSTRTPLLGKTVISTFREHHHQPLKMLEHGFFERNGWNCGGAAALLLPVLVFSSVAQNAFVSSCLISCSFFLGGTNQIHAWAHKSKRPVWVTRLQRWGIILAPHTHYKHHRKVESSGGSSMSHPVEPVTLASVERFTQGHYCITSGAWDRLFSFLRRRPIDRQYPPASSDLAPGQN